MNDPSWMYRNSLKELYRQDHLQGVKSFINFALSNPKNISVGKIRCSCVKCKNKKFHYKNVVMINLLKKRFIEKYLCWLAQEEPYVPYKMMLERMIGLTSRFSNIIRFMDDNNNLYRSIMMDTLRMNQGLFR